MHRSVTLLHVFLAASALILAVGGLVLGILLTTTLRNQAVSLERVSLSRYVDGVLRDDLVRGNHVTVDPRHSAALLRAISRRPDLITVKVWRRDGTLAWTNRARERIGRRFELEGELGEAIRENQSVGSIGQLGNAPEHAVERHLGYDHVLEVYAPIEGAGGVRAIGAYEIYANPTSLESLLASRRRLIWIAVGAVFLVLYAALALLVRGASSMLHSQTRVLRRRSQELLESYRLLETSALEAIESLNATVDAKDPYTAGHSQRVQRIALAIGDELALENPRRDALRFGGLFHDIGKLGVPDAILTKPARLTPCEYDVIKRHPADGALIVEKFSRLREAVPLIRHHHERWDGSGYPDGLAGDAIPLEAAIVGLADAWDAMTTERPYHRALTLQEATDEIRRGRGTQFTPQVVDAFFAALRHRPEQFNPNASVEVAAAAS